MGGIMAGLVPGHEEAETAFFLGIFTSLEPTKAD